ncbi:MAG TPA: ATP-binding protein [Candidatus Aphodovivens excrementavium]|nr:ATP-binding protein [Candidatus Aphodovivens excrementavium]
MSNQELTDFIETASSVSPFRVESDFGNGFVRLRSEEAERRQAAQDIRCTEDIIIEAFRNSRDAHARSIFLATSKEGSERHIVIIDDGDGVPADMHDHIFEPRVTSKLNSMRMDKWGVHGRGMALYSIAENCVTARVVQSDLTLGSSFEFVSDTAKLKEKTDQSTFPSFYRTEGNTVTVRGPKNILRTTCEFALESVNTCTVYIGSFAEIVATLYAFALSSLTTSQRLFCTDATRIPICKRLALAGDASHLAELAADIGLSVSERTCRRVLDGDITPCEPVLDRIAIVDPKNTKASRPKTAKRVLTQDDRGLKLANEDSQAFLSKVKKAYADLARDYYLEPDVAPRLAIRRDELTISIPLRKV